VKITASIDISSVPKEVSHWINDPNRAMRWQSGVKKGVIIKETSDKIGTTFIEELEENGKILIMHGEIKGYIPDKFISFKLESKIHRVIANYSIDCTTNKSTVMVDAIITWKFPMNIISLVIGGKIKTNILRQINSELVELKKLCESS
jgi:hypothetical protein